MTVSPQPPDSYGPYQPVNYAMPGATITDARPASVTVMSILAIIFGSLGLLCGVTGLAAQLAMLATGGRNPFAPSVPVMHNTGVLAYGAVAGIVRLAFSAVLLAGGIGGLKLRPWARPAMIRWSVALIILATINLVVVLVWINPVTVQYMRDTQFRTNPQAANAVGSMMGPLQAASAFIGWLLECVLPVCFLIFWRWPNVVAAFEPPVAQQLDHGKQSP